MAKRKSNYSGFLFIASIVLAVLLLSSAGGYIYWNSAPPAKTCISCHEITGAFDMWARSSHRDFDCKTCHGTALSNGWHSLTEKANMVISHYKEDYIESIGLNEQQVWNMMDRCVECHQDQYANWLSGGHAATYADVFLHEEHNSTEQLNADCLRCHGMFYEGTIEDLVEPISIEGPWHLKEEGHADKPTMPCLTCHSVHEENFPTTEPSFADVETIHYQRLEKIPTIGLYYRYEKDFFRVQELPRPKLLVDEKPIKVSDDLSQRLCVQCHAPNSFHMNGSHDDRTPRGVHEGLSCKSCHQPHSNNAKGSCVTCHPAISNCGLDVETMNTTYADPESPHNIHFVSCKDCHPKMQEN